MATSSIVVEVSVALFLDSSGTLAFQLDPSLTRVLTGKDEFLHAGEWTTFNDALAEWLVTVLPEDALPEDISTVSVVVGAKPRMYGRVTATRLNVRPQPGTGPDNPVLEVLVEGTYVTVFEDQLVNDEPWYRIGPARWVHSKYVDLMGGFGGGGVGTSARTRPLAAPRPPRKIIRAGSAKLSSETG
jgi:hypothetical protein